MAAISVLKNSFTGGEWDPALYDRFDLEKYGTAVKMMKNMFAHPHGGVSNRGGTEHAGEVKTSANRTRLVPFQFSILQTYMLEFGNNYIRFYKDRSRIFEADKTITGITQANPGVVTSNAHGYSNGDWVEINSVVGMTQLNGRMFMVAGVTANTFQLQTVDGVNVNTSSYTAYSSAGTASKVYQITTTYVTADLPLLKFEQSADVLYIWHPSYNERQLTRSGHTSWTITDTTYGAGIAAPTGFARTAGAGTGSTYAVTAVAEDGEESVPSSTATGGSGDTFGWNTVSGADSYNFYELENGLYKLLGSAVGLSFVVPTTDPDAAYTAPRAKTPFSGANNRPGLGAFFQQRLYRFRTNNYPQSIFGSVVASFDNMNIRSPLREDDALTLTLNSKQVNEIRWAVALDALLIGTSGSEWVLKAGANSDAVTPLSRKLDQQSNYGSSNVPPLVIGNTVLFVDISGKIVRDFQYSLEVDRYTGNDLSILANHLTRDYNIEEWSYQPGKDSTIWAVREDGVLLGLTYHKEHQVWGWHQHETEGTYESVATIPDGNGGFDTYVIVKRTIGGATRRYVEIMRNRLPSDDVRDSFFVDSGLSLDIPLSISSITAANPVVVTTAASHGLLNGDRVDLSDIEGRLNTDGESELNGKQFIVANKTGTTFELTAVEDGSNINGTGWTSHVSGSGYARKAETVISNLWHLEGEEVAVLANGNVVTGKTVASGQITLMNPASRVHVGLGYTAELETLDFVYDTQQGTVKDKLKNITSVLVQVERTRALYMGPSADRLVEFKFRDQEDYSAPISLYTGPKEKFLEQAEDYYSSSLYVQNPHPVPLTILSITARMDHGEV